MKKKHSLHKALGLVLTCTALSYGQTAAASIDSGNSNGYGVSIDLTLLGSDLLSVEPLPVGAAGVAPTVYGQEKEFANLNVNVGVPGVVTAHAGASLINGTAYSNVDGLTGNKTTDATGSVAGLGVNAKGVLGANLLGLNATLLTSNAKVTGDYGSLSAIGDSIITGLSLNIAGISLINFDAYINAEGRAAKNTTVDLGLGDLAKVSLKLNEQIETCFADTCSLEVNALRLSFDSFLLSGSLLSGDIILGHSYAQMDASPVPVPAAAWLFGSGIVGLIGLSRRRQTQVIA